MVQVSARVCPHKSVKRVGVDLVIGNSHGAYIADDEELAFARIGFMSRIGLATSEERSSGMGAGSILSTGLRTRFRIMWTREAGVWTLFQDGGAHHGGALWCDRGFVFLNLFIIF